RRRGRWPADRRAADVVVDAVDRHRTVRALPVLAALSRPASAARRRADRSLARRRAARRRSRRPLRHASAPDPRGAGGARPRRRRARRCTMPHPAHSTTAGPRWALVLGASTGTGAAVARALARDPGLHVFGVHRGHYPDDARALEADVCAAGGTLALHVA